MEHIMESIGFMLSKDFKKENEGGILASGTQM